MFVFCREILKRAWKKHGVIHPPQTKNVYKYWVRVGGKREPTHNQPRSLRIIAIVNDWSFRFSVSLASLVLSTLEICEDMYFCAYGYSAIKRWLNVPIQNDSKFRTLSYSKVLYFALLQAHLLLKLSSSCYSNVSAFLHFVCAWINQKTMLLYPCLCSNQSFARYFYGRTVPLIW